MIKWLLKQLRKLKRRSKKSAVVAPLPLPLLDLPIEKKIPEIPSNEVQIINIIGHGSYGKVYKGTWENKTVAIKEISQRSSTDNEAEIIYQLDHQNIVKLLGISRFDSYLFPALIMEYMAKGDLFVMMQDKNNFPYIVQERVRIAQEISAGVEYLHNNKIIHRDLKTDNILLSDTGRATITDFGLAVKYKGEEYIATQSVGSYLFSAPEARTSNANGDYVLTPKTDIYSVGCVLFSLWHFSLPPQQGMPDPISPETPTHVKELILNLWSADPKLRYAAAQIGPRLSPA